MPTRSTKRQRGGGIPALAREIEGLISANPSATVPVLRAIRRAYSRRLKDASPQFVIGLALRLSGTRRPTPRFVAYELVRHHPRAPLHIGARHLGRLGRGIASWGAVDCFAVYLAGPAWRRRRVPDGLIHRWAHSPDRWWRRVALVSTVPLNSRAQGGAGDRRRTLRVCRLLERDRDPMVVKALSCPGRLELAAVLTNGATVYVDYAHTPDALYNVLRSLRPHVGAKDKLHVLFGCGGDRDRGKRPIMGRIAAEHSDCVWVTDDNPRTEDPDTIRRQVLSGATGASRATNAGPRREALKQIGR